MAKKLASEATVEELRQALVNTTNEIESLERTQRNIENELFQRLDKTVDYRLTDFYINI